MQQSAPPATAEQKRIYRRAMAYFTPDWPWIAMLVLLIGVNVVVGLLEAWPLAILIDRVLTQNPRGDWIHDAFLALLPADKTGQIVGLVLIGLALQVVGHVAWMARMMINCHLGYRGSKRVRLDLFGKLQSLGLAWHRARPQGDKIYRLTTDAFGPWGVTDVMIGTSVAVVTLAVMTAILVSRYGSLALAAFAVAPLIVASNWWFGVRIHQRALASKRIDAELTAEIQQAMTRVPLSQAFRREKAELTRFDVTVERSIGALLRLNWLEQLYPMSREIILAVGTAIILGYGGWLVWQDQFVAPVASGMTVGGLIVFMDYLRKLWDPLKWVTEFFAKVRLYEAASRRAFEVLDTPEPIRDAPGALALPVAPRSLVLDRVSFRYPTGEPVLCDLSVAIRPGEMVAFIGDSGAGKSTLLGLLVRAFDPVRGAVRLGDEDIRDVRLADVRAHVAFVAQDSIMLSASIAENIAYGRPGASLAEIARAARLAGAEFIEALPEGYDTVLAEGGSNLSGGQRQRLAIARALLTEAPILVLDEPTSALDPASEAQVVRTLAALAGQRTVVIVTHRHETALACERVLRLDNGRLSELPPKCTRLPSDAANRSGPLRVDAPDGMACAPGEDPWKVHSGSRSFAQRRGRPHPPARQP